MLGRRNVWYVMYKLCKILNCYRIYAPGEAVDYGFSRLPELHTFPAAEMDTAILRTAVAYMPRQEAVTVVRCRSRSPSIETHMRKGRKTLDESKIKRSGKNESKKLKPDLSSSLQKSEEKEGFGIPVPSTSSEVESDGKSKKMGHPVRQKVFTSCAKDYGSAEEELIKQKPPIGRKYFEDKNSKGVTKVTHCPISQTPKRKVDQLSPTMRYAHEYPNVSLESQDSQDIVSYVTANSEPDIDLHSEKFNSFFSDSTPTSNEHQDCKTPFKIGERRNISPKPTSLSVSTCSSFIGTKRLPSPKVLVTGHAKPEPSLFKKRCIDLQCPESSTDEMQGCLINSKLKPVEEFISSDISDLTKPLSPSDIEAYLSSLSYRSPRQRGVLSKLEDIPTRKCSFYIEDEPDAHIDKRVKSKSEENHSDGYMDPADDPCLSSSQNVQSSSKPSSHVRKLFSDATESVESHDDDDVIDENIVDHESNRICHNGVAETMTATQNDSGFVEPMSFKTNHAIVDTNSSLSMENTASVTSELTSQNSAKVQPCFPTSKLSATLQMKEKEGKQNSREVISSTVQRELTLQNLSIPCSVGKNSADLSVLASDLESMEIDECPPCKLDKEVEYHLTKQTVNSAANCANELKSFRKPLNQSIINSSQSTKSATEQYEKQKPQNELNNCDHIDIDKTSNDGEQELTPASTNKDDGIKGTCFLTAM